MSTPFSNFSSARFPQYLFFLSTFFSASLHPQFCAYQRISPVSPFALLSMRALYSSDDHRLDSVSLKSHLNHVPKGHFATPSVQHGPLPPIRCLLPPGPIYGGSIGGLSFTFICPVLDLQLAGSSPSVSAFSQLPGFSHLHLILFKAKGVGRACRFSFFPDPCAKLFSPHESFTPPLHLIPTPLGLYFVIYPILYHPPTFPPLSLHHKHSFSIKLISSIPI